MIRVFLILGLINSFLFSLSDQELNEIKERVNNNVMVAPNFTLNSIQSNISDSSQIDLIEKEVTLDSLRGKVVLINFWASWCRPCIMEIPDLNELYNEYNNEGLEILAISISDGKKQLVNFIDHYAIQYPLLYGNEMEMQKITYEYGGIYSIPTSVLINKKNELIKIYPGAILKQYDPFMYADLVNNIKYELSQPSIYEE